MNAHRPPAPSLAPIPLAQTGAQLPASRGALASHSRIARVAGEAFDADQIGWTCDECDRDEYACDCEPEPWFTTPSPMSIEEARERIAEAFAPSGWLLAEQSLTVGDVK